MTHLWPKYVSFDLSLYWDHSFVGPYWGHSCVGPCGVQSFVGPCLGPVICWALFGPLDNIAEKLLI